LKEKSGGEDEVNGSVAETARHIATKQTDPHENGTHNL